ncbi:PREDICTED: lymphocyte antigen 86 [Gavialis gangeticus]|uniref:lymphocyte antigen 86 n=1 Tax=Gavialis gangeticus TaxID=94835 RepID=UPI00092F727D|nr:PREDICTED: lymphocyte antigen 86 [Gavialis gangeticus]
MVNAVFLLLVLLYPNLSTEWPTHTICKEDDLEIDYRSCDPLQDFALSIDRCSEISSHTLNIRAGMLLRHNIKALYLKANLIINGRSVLSYSDSLCEPDHPKFLFCGKKKGEQLYYEGPISLGNFEVPQGDYVVSLKLVNEDRFTVLCADFTIKNHQDYPFP